MNSGRLAWEIADRAGHVHALFGGLLEIVVTRFISEQRRSRFAAPLEAELRVISGLDRAVAHRRSISVDGSGASASDARRDAMGALLESIGRTQAIAANVSA